MGQISFVSFVRPHLCLLVPTVRIILNSLTANGYLSVAPNGKSMMFTGLWMNKCQRGQRFDPEPGVPGSKGFTWGKVYWEVKVDRIWWEAEEEEDAGDTGLEAEACLTVEILDLQASLMGIILLDTERRMRRWRRNGLRKMEYGQISAWWGWQESQW